MKFFYRDFADNNIVSKTFKLTEETQERIHFISRSLNVKQGDVLEYALDFLYSSDKELDYIMASAMEDPLTYFDLKAEVIGEFKEWLNPTEGILKEDDETFYAFCKTLQEFLNTESTYVSKMISENQKLQEYFEQPYDALLFMRTMPVWTEEMYEMYQEVLKLIDVNPVNLMFLNALGVKIKPDKYIPIRLSATSPLLQSMVKSILDKNNELSQNWKKFNMDIVKPFNGAFSYVEIHTYVKETATDEFSQLVQVLDDVLVNSKNMAPIFKAELFL